MESLRIGTSWPGVWHTGRAPRRILLNRECVGEWSWRMRPSFLHGRGGRREHLFAGPWVGEFGWELMNWQAYVRALRPHYRRITVSCRASSEALYADCADAFFPHDVRGQANAHVVFDVENREELKRVLDSVPPDADHLVPLRYIPLSAQSFVRFGKADKALTDVLIHARGNTFVPGRNWPAAKWEELASALREHGYRVAAVGLSESTCDVPGVEDWRDRPLQATMDCMAGARLIVGPSSGPMHLASLCGLPQLVWTDKRTYGMRKTSREKYETWWNPLGTAVRVVDEFGFDPPVEHVVKCAMEMLHT